MDVGYDGHRVSLAPGCLTAPLRRDCGLRRAVARSTPQARNALTPGHLGWWTGSRHGATDSTNSDAAAGRPAQVGGGRTRRPRSASCLGSTGVGALVIGSAPDWVLGYAM